MCIKCHRKISAEIVLQQLKDSISNPQYEIWNRCSISHLFLAAIGSDGQEAATLAIKLLNDYIKWYDEEMKKFHEAGCPKEEFNKFITLPTSEYVVGMGVGVSMINHIFNVVNIKDSQEIRRIVLLHSP